MWLVKNTLILLFLGVIFLFLGQAEACMKASVLEDISLPGQKAAEGYRNMMTIAEGMEAFCTVNPHRPDLFDEAKARLQYQEELIELLLADGEIRPNGAKYYRAFMKDVRANLLACEAEAIRIRSIGNAPHLEKVVDLLLRPDDLIEVTYFDKPGGTPQKRIISHKIWFGRIIQQDGYDLCETELR